MTSLCDPQSDLFPLLVLVLMGEGRDGQFNEARWHQDLRVKPAVISGVYSDCNPKILRVSDDEQIPSGDSSLTTEATRGLSHRI